jgi:hypothetical protein
MKNFAEPLDRVIPRTQKEDRGYSTECWIWTGATNEKGYGRVRVNGILLLTHRFVYEQIVGPIAAGLQLDHLCRAHACCNPEHMEPVTNRENGRRGLKGILSAKWQKLEIA